VDKRAGQVGEAVVCHGAGQPRQQSRSLQTAARGRLCRLQGRDCRCRIELQGRRKAGCVGCRVGIAVAG
jgi:hypothetical protein